MLERKLNARSALRLATLGQVIDGGAGQVRSEYERKKFRLFLWRGASCLEDIFDSSER